MSEIVEGYVRNKTFDEAFVTACSCEGLNWFKCFRLKLALRRCSDADHCAIEQEATRLLVGSGVALPVGATIVNGLLVGTWQDFLDFLIEFLPVLLDFLMKILPFIIGLF